MLRESAAGSAEMMAGAPASADYKDMGPDWSRPSTASDAPEAAPSDELIRVWLAQGVAHAEMAVRLGISVGDIKARIERLNPARIEPIETPLTAAASVHRRQARRLAVALGAGTLVAGVVTGAVLRPSLSQDQQPEEQAILIPWDEMPIVSLDQGPRRTASPAPKIVIGNGAETVHTGRLFWTSGHPTGIASVQQLGEEVQVTLTADAFLRLSNGTVSWRPIVSDGSVVTLQAVFHGTARRLTIRPANAETKLLIGEWDSAAVFSTSGVAPEVFVEVEGGHAEFGDHGELLLVFPARP